MHKQEKAPAVQAGGVKKSTARKVARNSRRRNRLACCRCHRLIGNSDLGGRDRDSYLRPVKTWCLRCVELGGHYHG